MPRLRSRRTGAAGYRGGGAAPAGGTFPRGRGSGGGAPGDGEAEEGDLLPPDLRAPPRGGAGDPAGGAVGAREIERRKAGVARQERRNDLRVATMARELGLSQEAAERGRAALSAFVAAGGEEEAVTPGRPLVLRYSSSSPAPSAAAPGGRRGGSPARARSSRISASA